MRSPLPLSPSLSFLPSSPSLAILAVLAVLAAPCCACRCCRCCRSRRCWGAGRAARRWRDNRLLPRPPPARPDLPIATSTPESLGTSSLVPPRRGAFARTSPPPPRAAEPSHERSPTPRAGRSKVKIRVEPRGGGRRRRRQPVRRRGRLGTPPVGPERRTGTRAPGRAARRWRGDRLLPPTPESPHQNPGTGERGTESLVPRAKGVCAHVRPPPPPRSRAPVRAFPSHVGPGARGRTTEEGQTGEKRKIRVEPRGRRSSPTANDLAAGATECAPPCARPSPRSRSFPRKILSPAD